MQSYVDSVAPEERASLGIPARLTTMEQIADAVMLLATDESLAGRLMVWWSNDEAPKLVPIGDRGYVSLDDIP